MINLILFLRCKEERFWVMAYKRALASRTRIGAVSELTIDVLKSILFAPFMLPIKLLVRAIFEIADGLRVDWTKRKLFWEFADLNKERESLRKKFEAEFC